MGRGTGLLQLLHWRVWRAQMGADLSPYASYLRLDCRMGEVFGRWMLESGGEENSVVGWMAAPGRFRALPFLRHPLPRLSKPSQAP